MISKCIIVCALAALAAPALGSAIKGHSQLALAPFEQQQTRLEHVDQHEEQQQLVAEQQREILEPIQQQKEILVQQKEEPAIKAPLRYEAKPQVNLEEQKGGLKYEQHRQQEPERLEQVQVQQQVVVQRESQFEGQQQLVEEQRRYEEPLVQPIAPLEESRGQVKGASLGAVQAPAGEPEPYAFSYQVDGSSRSESGDTKGVVRGQYTVQGADGASRIVDYIADHNGFRASVNTNEFGTEAKSPANVVLRSSQPSAEEISLKLEGKTRDESAHSATGIKGAQLPAKPESWAVKAPALLPEHDAKGGVKRAPLEAPIKGQKLVQQQEELQQELVHLAPQEQAPIKSANLRSPKLIGELKLAPAQARSGFESATAHRALYRAPPTYVARPAPAIAVRPQAPLPLFRGPVPAVARAHLQRDRYPQNQVQVGYRRPLYSADQLVQPANPRVSFYSPSSAAHFDDEQPSFEQPEI